MLSVNYREKYSPIKDIDIDLAASRRPAIFEAIRRERGPLGLVQVCTFGTETTKSAILVACRGYRSEEYSDGIPVEQAQYMSSLIPSERGFLWPLTDVVYGNPDRDRKPVRIFLNEVNKYPRLLEIMLGIEGTVNKRSSHASGVILFDDDPYEIAALMKTPSGDIITQWNLGDSEKAGATKYDFLITEVSDKIIECLHLLQEDGVIDKNLTLRETYNKYLHPDVLDTSNPVIWEHLAKGDILDVFQFNEGSGLAIAKKLKPQNVLEMTAANAAMRLMSEKGKESQQDRFARIKNQGIQVFTKEMNDHNIPLDIQEKLHKHCDNYYGCVPLQEQMMEILMDIAGFSLAQANSARKIVAKKKMSKIPELKAEFYSQFDDTSVADYVWETAVAPQLGYAFSLNHSTPYSIVGVQTIELATRFNPIYWNTACLIVNSGSLFEDTNESTDYTKIAKAIGGIRKHNISLSLVDINKSDFKFKPDIEHNTILYGMKALNNVGTDLIKEIIANRPYTSMMDFYIRVNPGKRAMISLIKSGAFDQFESRQKCMVRFLWYTCDKKSRITLQNMPALMKYDLIPPELDMEKRIYEFNRYLKAECKAGSFYSADERVMNFLAHIELDNLVDERKLIDQKAWEKHYKVLMNPVRQWATECQLSILEQLNTIIFMEDWKKYAKGSISAWEMESLCFYYHEHELAHINNSLYGFADFEQLSATPLVEKVFHKGDFAIPIYKIYKICGTCIAKNKDKGIVYLLTTTGVVPVKLGRELFAMFDKQISVPLPEGGKKIVEKSWFNRGEKVVFQGIRRGDDFVVKKYASTPGHRIYHIDEIYDNGELYLRSERYEGEVTDAED